MDLTESQKILVTQLAAVAGCEATMPALTEKIGELRLGYHAGRRMLFSALGEMPLTWIDEVMSRMIARAQKKG